MLAAQLLSLCNLVHCREVLLRQTLELCRVIEFIHENQKHPMQLQLRPQWAAGHADLIWPTATMLPYSTAGTDRSSYCCCIRLGLHMMSVVLV